MKKILFLLLVIAQTSFAQTSIRTVHSAIGKIIHCEFSVDGKLAVACSETTDFYGEKVAAVIVFDAEKETVIKELAIAAFFATLSPDNAKLLYWDFSKGLVIRNLADDHEKVIVENKEENAVFKAKFSRDGKLIALACFDGSVKIMDATTYKIIRVLSSNADKKMVVKLDFMSDGTLVTMGGGVAKTWDVQTGKEIRAYSRANFDDMVIGFATELNKVVMCFKDSVFITETKTGKVTAKNDYANFYNGAFSPKGSLYLLCDTQGVYAFNGDGTFGEQNGIAFPDCAWLDINRSETKVVIATEVNVLMVDFDYFKSIVMRNK
jgi:WD40 repeat protein